MCRVKTFCEHPKSSQKLLKIFFDICCPNFFPPRGLESVDFQATKKSGGISRV